MLYEAAAEVFIVVLDAQEHIAKGESIALQGVRIHFDHILLGVAAPTVDLIDTGDGAQLEAQAPVVESLAIHERETVPVDGVLQDFAEGSGDGSECRLQALRQTRAHLLDPLVDQLTGEVGVHLVFEDDRRHGKTELGGGSDFQRPRESHQGGLNGKSDAALHLEGRHRRAFGDDDDLIVREIGEGIDGQAKHDDQAHDDDGGQQGGHQKPVVQGCVDDAIEHGAVIPPEASS
ncbi:MAG: hypothetical protein QM755_09775 [Luteolibacter sp.]